VTDNELRGVVLKKFYDLRERGPFQWAEFAEKDIDEQDEAFFKSVGEDLFRICNQLAERGFVEWTSLPDGSGRSCGGYGQISALGVDAIEKATAMKPVGDIWGLIRGTLRQKFSFGEIQDLTGASGFPVEELANIEPYNKVALVTGIENLLGKFEDSEREDSISALVEEMVIRRPEITSELERALARAGWTLKNAKVLPISEAKGQETHSRPVPEASSSGTKSSLNPSADSRSEKEVNIAIKRIFIGHGRSPVWRELKDFIQDTLRLSWEEFNREPVAGMHTVERLQQMLDAACFAFIVMTGEDVSSDGERKRARSNVIHEAGLFQGRLGFRRAIILLEDGCEEFSNIAGLTEIRFPKDDILARSEEIRKVLIREGILKEK
jgi:hypothetical protein